MFSSQRSCPKSKTQKIIHKNVKELDSPEEAEPGSTPPFLPSPSHTILEGQGPYKILVT